MGVKWETIPQESDYEAMRAWDKTRFHDYDRNPHCRRRRSAVPVAVEDVTVEYGKAEKFGIRIYNPEVQSDALRPILLMYHGGGFTHGDSTSDEGAQASCTVLKITFTKIDLAW